MDSEDTFMITGGPLKGHEYIVVKREMTAADEAWIQNHSATLVGDKKNPQLQLTIGEVRLATLKRMIVRWHLTKKVIGLEGKTVQVPVELSEKAIENLPARISNYVHEALSKLDDEAMAGESDEDFLPDAAAPSEENSETMKSIPAKG